MRTPIIAVGCSICLATPILSAQEPQLQGDDRILSDPQGPIITEISPRFSAKHPAWIELFNPTEDEIDLGRIELRFPFVNEPVVLDSEKRIRRGEYALICFADSSSRKSRKRCPVHAKTLFADPDQTGSSLTPGFSQVAVFMHPGNPSDPPMLVDFVVAGGPPRELPKGYGSDLVSWHRHWVFLTESTGMYDPTTRLERGTTIGRLMTEEGEPTRRWVASAMSPGATTSSPHPRIITPPAGSNISIDDATVVWHSDPDDQGFCVQVAQNRHFSRGLKTFFIQPADGAYFRPSDHGVVEGKYHVRVGRAASESQCRNMTSALPARKFQLSGPTLDRGKCIHVDGVRYAYQRKDTPMVCLERCREPTFLQYACGCNRLYWDRPHPPKVPFNDTATCVSISAQEPEPDVRSLCPPIVERGIPSAPTWGKHGQLYCVHASISMMASAYQGRLSQDRVAYQDEWLSYTSADVQDPGPWQDLGHAVSMSPCVSDAEGEEHDGGRCTELLRWAMGLDPFEATSLVEFFDRPLTFDEMWDILESGRPIMSRWKGDSHMRVIDGIYWAPRNRFFGKPNRWLRILDPKAGGPAWHEFRQSDWSANAVGTWIGPRRMEQITARCDETSIWKDSDGDGLVDFDESHRLCTDPNDADINSNNVPDKQDLALTIFRPHAHAAGIDFTNSTKPCPKP